MRSLAEAEASWSSLRDGLTNLQDARKTGALDRLTLNHRAAVWKIALWLQSGHVDDWPTELQRGRQRWSQLYTHHIDALDNIDELESFSDPLSGDSDSKWEQLRKDEQLRKEILQDVLRCMPENLYFQQPDTQDAMVNVLFVWSKLNPDVSYRQGMHEVLAPVLWVFERDAISPESLPSQRSLQSEEINIMLDGRYIVADCFAAFENIMMGLRSAYETQPKSPINNDVSSGESPLAIRSRDLMTSSLRLVDVELYDHLKAIEMTPQIFLIRWIRLLFGREFALDDLLKVWDRLFVEDSRLSLLDLMCVALLLRLRWQLLDCDYNAALSILLKIPTQPQEHPAYTLVDDARHLQNHFNLQGGSDVVLKRTGRVLPPQRPITPNQSKQDDEGRIVSTHEDSLQSPPRTFRNTGGFETLLQDAAKTLQERGERLGINKAVREAVGEVRKNVRDIQARTHSRNSSSVDRSGAQASDKTSTKILQDRLDALAERNKNLSQLLGTAVTDLWQQHEALSTHLSNKGETESTHVAALAMGIAKVQLAQVYLEDSSLSVPAVSEMLGSTDSKEAPSESTKLPHANPPAGEAVESTTRSATSDSVVASVLLDRAEASSAADGKMKPSHTTPKGSPSKRTASDKTYQNPTSQSSMAPNSSQPFEHVQKGDDDHPKPEDTQTKRPALAQSSFSWMLGQGEPSSKAAFMSSNPFVERHARNHSSEHSFLFGDDSSEASQEPRSRSNSKSKPKPQKQKKGSVSKSKDTTTDEGGFRLGDFSNHEQGK